MPSFQRRYDYTTVEVMICVKNRILLFYIDVITYPSPQLLITDLDNDSWVSVDLLVSIKATTTNLH